MVDSVAFGRVYDEFGPESGTCLLVDRLWPRGISRDRWPEGSWRPELAPSTELRRWFHQHPERYAEFALRYRHELDENGAVGGLLSIDGPVTLVTASRHPERSHVSVLVEYVRESTGNDPG